MVFLHLAAIVTEILLTALLALLTLCFLIQLIYPVVMWNLLYNLNPGLQHIRCQILTAFLPLRSLSFGLSQI